MFELSGTATMSHYSSKKTQINFDGFQTVSSTKKKIIKTQDKQTHDINKQLFILCKDGIELEQSEYFQKAYYLLNQYNRNFFIKFNKTSNQESNQKFLKSFDNIFCLFFHYEFSHGNLEKCEQFISLMDSNTMSYERHCLKYRVLNWWINQRCVLNRKQDTIYQELMIDIFNMLNKKMYIELNDKNSYQILRDLIFYFKMGLYNTPFDIMKQKTINRYRLYQINDSILFEIKLLQRIDYIENELINETNGLLYVGIIFDDINTNIDCVHMNKNIIRYDVLFK